MLEANCETLEKVRPLFKDIRFYMGKSVLDGKLGKAYVDNLDSPKYACLKCKVFYFINGDINAEELESIINEITKGGHCLIVTSDSIGNMIEEKFIGQFTKKQRYSIKKNPSFDEEKLNYFIQKLDPKYELKNIDKGLSERIVAEKFKDITEDFEHNGIGVCCLYNDELIGVCSSNIIYEDGIEVNVGTKEEYQRQGIATAMAAKLILRCLECGKKISWDAANLNSVKLAEKLGFEYDKPYDVYIFGDM